MLAGTFTINGTNSEELDLYMQTRPLIEAPKRRVSIQQSLQQDGSLRFDEDSYDNTKMKVTLASMPPGAMSPSINDAEYVSLQREKIYKLFDYGKYVNMVPYFDTEKVYRVALDESGDAIQFESKRFLNRAQVISLSLTVQPWKLLAGQEMHEVKKGSILINPKDFVSRPLIKITGKGDTTLSIGNAKFVLKGLTGDIILDSEIEEAYSENTAGEIIGNRNDKCYTLDFIQIPSGSHVITWTGSEISKVEINERWRSLV